MAYCGTSLRAAKVRALVFTRTVTTLYHRIASQIAENSARQYIAEMYVRV
jgi:hypothetical protein